MSTTNDRILDAIADVMGEDVARTGMPTHGMLVWAWHDERGEENISVATTDRLPGHVMLGFAGWLDAVAKTTLMGNTYDPEEDA